MIGIFLAQCFGVIEDEVGVPKAEQRIFFFDDDGDELDGNTPIGKAGLKAGSVLEMRSPPPEENNITLKLPNRNFVFDFDPDSDTLDDIKRKIEEDSQKEVPGPHTRAHFFL